LRNLNSLRSGSWLNLERLGVLVDGWVGDLLQLDAVQLVCTSSFRNGPLIFALGAQDALLDRFADLESDVRRSLEKDDVQGGDRLGRFPFDSVCLAGSDDVAEGRLLDGLEAFGCLRQDGGGSGQCQQGGLDEGVLHYCDCIFLFSLKE
jgi:hypothetical protein